MPFRKSTRDARTPVRGHLRELGVEPVLEVVDRHHVRDSRLEGERHRGRVSTRSIPPCTSQARTSGRRDGSAEGGGEANRRRWW